MTPTNAILQAIAQWLHAEGLAKYDANGTYQETGQPAIVFADSDTPDTSVVLEVVADHRLAPPMRAGTHAGKSGIEVRFTWRAPGQDSRRVEAFGDAVTARLTTLRYAGPPDDYNTYTPLTLNWGQIISAEAVQLLERKPAELAPRSKYAGDRYVRRDTYRVGIH